VVAAVLSLVLVAAAVEIVVDASVGRSPMVPPGPPIAGWLSGLGVPLDYDIFLPTLIVSCFAYLGLIVLARSESSPISVRWAVALTAILQLIVFVGPVLLATDLYTNVAYARLGVLHGLNPYVHGPAAAALDPVYPYVSPDWIKWPDPYGPLFTLLVYPVAPLGLDGAIWGLKAEVLLASAGTLALTWRCARARAIDPVWALLVVGINPLYVFYAVGGSHNDLIMMVAMMAGVSLTIASRPAARREAAGGAALVAATLVKATAAPVLLFMLVAKRRVAPMLGALAAAAVGLAAGYAAFGVNGINLIKGLNRESALVSSYSFADMLAHLGGKPGVYPVDHELLKAGLVAVTLYLLWRTWRGYDWITAAGWVLLALTVTTTWLMPWYTIWPLPLAVISRDRRLLAATLTVQAFWVIHQMSPLVA
jgi:alpha-1,6-mannosyltransferase